MNTNGRVKIDCASGLAGMAAVNMGIITESSSLEAKCAELYKISTLPHKPDHENLNQICSQMITKYHKKYG